VTPLIRKTQPYTKRIAHRGIWVEPKLLAEIEYRANSAEGKVRASPLSRPARGNLRSGARFAPKISGSKRRVVHNSANRGPAHTGAISATHAKQSLSVSSKAKE
jgi:hypothetical protein